MSDSNETPSLVESGTPPAPPVPPTPSPTPEPVPPLTAEALKFPEGVEVDQEMTTGLLGVLNDQTLTPQARAQGLVDLHLKAVETASEKASQFYRDLQDEWVGQAIQEFGGEEKLRPMLGDIARLIDEYGGDAKQQAELRDLFSLTGAGNSPRMVGFLHNIAKKLVTEGKPLNGGVPSGQRSAAEILYPNMAKG